MTKIRINITKDILIESSTCGVVNTGIVHKPLVSHCAFALAVRDLLPEARVSDTHIYPFPAKNIEKQAIRFPLSEKMISFINKFDVKSPEDRRQMPEQSFELEIPDWAIEKMDISDVHQILAESKTMELIET